MSKGIYRHICNEDSEGYSACFELDNGRVTLGAGHVCDEREFHSCRMTPEQVRAIYDALCEYFEGE